MMMMRVVFENPGRENVYRETDRSNEYGLAKMNRHRCDEPVDGFSGHEHRDAGQNNRAGESAQHADLSRAKSELRVFGIPAADVIGERGENECRYMRAHVPAVRQQSHRVEHGAGHDFHDHHESGERDDFVRAFFRHRCVVGEIVAVFPRGNVGCMHIGLSRQESVGWQGDEINREYGAKRGSGVNKSG